MTKEILRISERVKTHTAKSHLRLEKSIVDCIRRLENPQDYIHLLGAFYSFFAGVELMVDAQQIIRNLPDFDERRKTVSILEDVIALHGQLPAILAFPYLPEIGNSFQAFGALYVSEGSTLGGVYIVKMIQKKLLPSVNAYKFFSGHGELNFLMWEKFKHTLDHLSENEEDIAFILSAAENTFHKFGEWINSKSS